MIDAAAVTEEQRRLHVILAEPVIEEETITVDEAIANLKQSLAAAYAAEDHLKELLQREGLLD